ncbi:erythromycin esterase family protein [Sphingomonas sp. DT-51]|uniref:erythromycin esterase family protein n=1 Tax=Sphingomonas sp. DT-51 TaxID=3396165 RepID=UPI003F1DD31E
MLPASIADAPRAIMLSDVELEGAAAADFVLLGEATHGTSEFFTERGRITGPLVEDGRPAAIVIEADRAEVERANRYVRGIGTDRSAAAALTDFRRFPRWMWRNEEFGSFVERLRAINLQRPEGARVGLYGMDVYDLFGALDRARAFARREGGKLAETGEAAGRCFASFRRSTEAYGIAARKASRSCAGPAQSLLQAIQATSPAADAVREEERFAAVQAAAAVADGEAYFRAAYAGAYSWNVRERAMTAAIERVAEHVGRGQGASARVIVWAHNSHVADAASTAMIDRGEITIADLLRADGARQVFSIGFLTHAGTVMAGSAWGALGQIFRLAPAPRNSVEGLLRRFGGSRPHLLLSAAGMSAAFAEWRSQRGVGAVYQSGDPALAFSRVRLKTEFDATFFVAETHALRPLP